MSSPGEAAKDATAPDDAVDTERSVDSHADPVPPLATPVVQRSVVFLSVVLLIVGVWEHWRLPREESPSAGRMTDVRPTVDLNRASSRELGLLPGFGPVLARRVVEDRRIRGPFRSVDEIVRVSGVGVKTRNRLRGIAIVRPVERVAFSPAKHKPSLGAP